MLIEDEGYVKPASRESRLVMVQLEPSAKKQKVGKEPNEQEQEHTQNKSARKRDFFNQLKEACCDWEGPHGSSCA